MRTARTLYHSEVRKLSTNEGTSTASDVAIGSTCLSGSRPLSKLSGFGDMEGSNQFFPFSRNASCPLWAAALNLPATTAERLHGASR